MNKYSAKKMVRVPNQRRHKTVSTSSQKLVAPDGGWGWMVVFGVCLTLIFFPSLTVSFGVLFADHLTAMGADTAQFSSIGNALAAVWSFAALFMAPLSQLFGYRTITLLGGLMSFLAMTLSAFANTIITFALSYSVIGGIASAYSTFIGFIIIPRYFDKRRGFANGLASASSSLGKIFMPPLVRLLLDEYGYKWACLLVGALTLHTCVGGMLYHPPEWHMIPEKVTENTNDRRRLGSLISNGTDVCITENGIIEDSVDKSIKTHVDPVEEEEDNVIFVMPSTLNVTNTTKDDEVILFTRIPELSRQQSRVSNGSLYNHPSTLSLWGSLAVLPPLETNVYLEEEEEEEEEPTSFCNDFFIFKVFRMLNYSLLKKPAFHLVAWPNGIGILCYINFLFLLPLYVSSLGYSPYMSALSLSAFAVTEVTGRLVISWLTDCTWFPRNTMYGVGLCLAFLSTLGLPLVTSYEWILMCVLAFGLSHACCVVIFMHLCIDYLTLEQYPQVIGFCSILNGIILITGGPLIGWVRDYTQSYVAVYYLLAGFSTISIAIWAMVPCIKVIRSHYTKVPTMKPNT